MKQADNHKKYLKLRQEYPLFIFQSYSFQVNNEGLEAQFAFELSGKSQFHPTLKIPSRDFYQFDKLTKDELENFVFHIGMVELISYWKTACPPKLIVKPHALNKDQVEWWKKLYYNGLGEFFYLNGIVTTENDFMQIAAEGQPTIIANTPLSESKVLVPIGGGKDSIVTLELLKETNFELTPFVLNPREASERTITIAGFSMENSVVVLRGIDSRLIELNKQGYLNGHTPFSALLAFCSALTAIASETKYIALSNESSANESTIPGSNVNHQYSKSFEFEQDFVGYTKKYLHKGLAYFSFLRPVNELQIAKLFSNFKQHFHSFRSCNVGSKTDSWCGNCPKCLFTFAILSPFISPEVLKTIFEKDLFTDKDLLPILNELSGKAAIKPFECVGTPDEVRAALSKTIKDHGSSPLPYLLEVFQETPSSDSLEVLLDNFEEENYLPEKFSILLKQTLLKFQKQTFKAFLEEWLKGRNKVLILGFGLEGKSSYQLLRAYFPELIIEIADVQKSIDGLETLSRDKYLKFQLGEDYLNALQEHDHVLKSPGVSLNKMPLVDVDKISSQTDLFLRYFKAQTIGVTGTKGKSTTVSLIKHLLIKSGKKAVLLGNIGIPAFDLVREIDPETIVVFELSAHQLEYLHSSPRVAVLLNVFPEHLDHFEHFNKYRDAKLNIFKYQKQGDVAIEEDVENKTIHIGQLFTFSDENKGHAGIVLKDKSISVNGRIIEFDSDLIPLKGKHNMKNILAALLAVSVFGVGAEKGMEYLQSFLPLAHRMEFVGDYQGICFYNDSISTVPESTIAAVETLKNVEILILGGFDRGIDYSGLVSFLINSHIEHIVFLGRAGDAMLNLFRNIDHTKKNLVKVENLSGALGVVKRLSVRGICLLSPAAASYDQYHNFEHRGDAYKEIINSLFNRMD